MMLSSINSRNVISVEVTRRGGACSRRVGGMDKVVLGTTVTLLNTGMNEFVTYKVVMESEADLKNGSISFASPLALAVIGKFAGQFVNVIAPGGTTRYKICEVKHI